MFSVRFSGCFSEGVYVLLKEFKFVTLHTVRVGNVSKCVYVAGVCI